MKLFARMLACAVAAFALSATAETSAHPLSGKILDARTGALTELSDPALIAKLFPCDAITLLGEVHDNPMHHEMRAKLIGSLRPGDDERCGIRAFVLEHISVDQQAGLDKFAAFDGAARRRATAGDLFRFLDWDKSGWPAVGIYAPLIQAIIDSGQPILAGNPGRTSTREVARNGVAALNPTLADRLRLAQPLAADLADDLLGELEASHCGLMPKSAFGNMATAQRYRDANMADVALAAAQARGSVVVLAGNGHIRTDRGVPYYLRSRAADRRIVAAAFVETEDGKTDPATYGPRDPQGKLAADFVAFALPAEREDPCEQMRKHMKK